MTDLAPETCALCHHEQASDRMYGLGLCRNCRDSGGDGMLERSGHQVRVEREHRPGGRYQDERFLYRVVIDLAWPAPFQGRFRSEAPLTHLSKWLPWVDEPTIGDPLFDDAVFVDVPDSPPLQAFLASPVVQDVLIEICREGTVEVEEARVVCAWSLARDRLEQELQLPGVLLTAILADLTPSSDRRASPRGTA